MKGPLAVVILAVVILGGGGLARADIQQAAGHITLLRVHELGTGFGPPTDQLDAEVIVQLDSQPDKTFGFQLRDDQYRPAREAMLALLRDSLIHDLPVAINFDIEPGRDNGVIVRVFLRPSDEARTRPVFEQPDVSMALEDRSDEARVTHRILEEPNVVIASEDPALTGRLDPSTLRFAPPTPPEARNKGAHELMEETRWGPVEQVVLASGDARTFNVPVETPSYVFVDASWVGARVSPTLQLRRTGAVLATGRLTPVAPDQGTLEGTVQLDATGDVAVVLANPGPAPITIQLTVGVLPLPS